MSKGVFRTAAIVALAFATSRACAADLDAAAELFNDGKAEEALAIARSAIEGGTRDARAYEVLVRSLMRLNRVREAVPDLEAWATTAPEDPAPLWLLLETYDALVNWPELDRLRSRADGLPATQRIPFVRTLGVTQLRGRHWAEARETLAALPSSESSTPLDDLFDALRGAARSEYYDSVPALSRYLDVQTDAVKRDQAVLWCAMLLPDRPIGGATRTGDDPDEIAAEPILPVPEVELPVRIREYTPEYPEEARRKKISGRVILQSVILPSGYVVWPIILVSRNPLFNEAAKEAVSRWKYRPATIHGKPVAIYFTIIVNFSTGGRKHASDEP